jgi:cysteine-rich repeat protein
VAPARNPDGSLAVAVKGSKLAGAESGVTVGWVPGGAAEAGELEALLQADNELTGATPSSQDAEVSVPSAPCALDAGGGCTLEAPALVPEDDAPPACGDGQRAGDEACDDGGRVDGDGCSADCAVEPGYVCDGDAPSLCLLEASLRVDELCLTERGGCLQTVDGAVRCWGALSLADDGDPADPSGHGAATVALPAAARDVACHGLGACAALDDGAVMCWGEQGSGELGQEDVAVEPPAAVTTVSDVFKVALGGGAPGAGGFACAVDGSGEVFCWGDNSRGQLGLGAAPDGGPGAVQVDVGGPVAELALGAAHACALRQDGEVLCWGANDAAQLGQGSAGDDQPAALQVAMPAPPDLIVAAGDGTCAYEIGGAVRCWGANTQQRFGAFGDVVGSPTLVGQLANAADLALGVGHACALSLEGDGKCLGDNARGQLGDGTRTSRDASAAVQLAGKAQRVFAGAHTSCVRDVNGSRWCWGDGRDDRLGLKRAPARPAPQAIALQAPVPTLGLASRRRPLEGATDVWPATDTPAATCALAAGGQVSCWGADAGLALGAPDAADRVTPGVLEAMGQRAALALGRDALCAAASATDSVACIGANQAGQLGDGGASPATATPVTTALGISVAALGGGEDGFCAWGDGQIRCWGSPFSPLLGSAENATGQPSPPAGLGPDGAAVTAACVGPSHACAALADGTVSCWGRNDLGQTGQPLDQTEVLAPAAVSGVSDAVALSCGGAHTCALRSGGAVTCWGANGSGQLGRGTTGAPATAPAAVAGLADVVGLSAGTRHTCARGGDGSVRCWGDASLGQLGPSADSGPAVSSPVAVDVPSAVRVVAGDDMTCAESTDGKLRCWGAVGCGGLGDGASLCPLTPALAAP